MQELFDYIESADKNLSCYSYRVHELLLRACVEVEANCKAILIENGYTRSGGMNMGDYEKINVSHRLSSYEVKLPFWHEAHSVRKAFSSWVTGGGLPCYQAYNATKHDRRESFDSATFEQMTDAMDGLILLLSSQFYIYDFGPGDTLLTADEPRDGMESSIGGYFRIRYPTDWPTDQQTDFLVLYVAGKPWEYQQITPLEFGVAFFLTCQAAVMFRDEKYYRAALNAPG